MVVPEKSEPQLIKAVKLKHVRLDGKCELRPTFNLGQQRATPSSAAQSATPSSAAASQYI
jgi:hypothetical protein